MYLRWKFILYLIGQCIHNCPTLSIGTQYSRGRASLIDNWNGSWIDDSSLSTCVAYDVMTDDSMIIIELIPILIINITTLTLHWVTPHKTFCGYGTYTKWQSFLSSTTDFGKKLHPFVDYSGLLPLTTTSLMMVCHFYYSSALISIGSHPLVMDSSSHDQKWTAINRWMLVVVIIITIRSHYFTTTTILSIE